MKYLNIPVFIVSLAVGMFFVYINNPNKRIVYVFPTPENSDKVQYKDSNDNCHSFTANEVQCPSDKSQISDYVIQ